MGIARFESNSRRSISASYRRLESSERLLQVQATDVFTDKQESRSNFNRRAALSCEDNIQSNVGVDFSNDRST